jgi:hypothetical protein
LGATVAPAAALLSESPTGPVLADESREVLGTAALSAAAAPLERLQAASAASAAIR